MVVAGIGIVINTATALLFFFLNLIALGWLLARRAWLPAGFWDGAEALSSLYTHLLVQLVQANVRRDMSITSHCLDLVVGLADAWRQAVVEQAKSA